MRIWTIQTLPAWEHFQTTGFLQASVAHIDPDFLDAYRWMRDQLKEHVGPPPAGIEFPVWAWYQYESAHRRLPDLRRSAHLPRGEVGIRLECEIPDHTILLSDFDLWHYVLNDWYLPADEADDAAFEERRQSRSVDEDQPQKVVSWQRILDLDWPGPDQDYPSTRDAKSIQGVLWEIHLDQVKVAKIFKAR